MTNRIVVFLNLMLVGCGSSPTTTVVATLPPETFNEQTPEVSEPEAPLAEVPSVRRCYELSSDGELWSKSPEYLCVTPASDQQYVLTFEGGVPSRLEYARFSYDLLKRARCMDCNKDEFGTSAATNSMVNQLKITFDGKRTLQPFAETGTVRIGSAQFHYRSAPADAELTANMTAPPTGKKCFQLSTTQDLWSKTPEFLCTEALGERDHTLSIEGGIPRRQFVEMSVQLLTRAKCMDCNKDTFGKANATNSLLNMLKVVFDGARTLKPYSENGTLKIGDTQFFYRFVPQAN